MRNDGNPDDAAIWFENNKGTVKLTDIYANESGTDGIGVLIDHNGTVQLTRVNSSNNGYFGARIHNTGAVTISNSTFDGNLQDVDNGFDYAWYDKTYDEYGNETGQVANYHSLEVYTSGPISVFGVSASDNIGDGAYLISYPNTITVKDSVFDGNRDYSGDPNNGISGMGLFADGNVLKFGEYSGK